MYAFMKLVVLKFLRLKKFQLQNLSPEKCVSAYMLSVGLNRAESMYRTGRYVIEPQFLQPLAMKRRVSSTQWVLK